MPTQKAAISTKNTTPGGCRFAEGARQIGSQGYPACHQWKNENGETLSRSLCVYVYIFIILFRWAEILIGF